VDEPKNTTVCFLGGEFAGVYFAAPNFTGPCSHIAKAGYVVTKTHRRRGVGRALVADSIRSAIQLGFDAMMFNLVMERNPSRQLYRDVWCEVLTHQDAPR
jgi:GNAT superfamily N-acetyltransferase